MFQWMKNSEKRSLFHVNLMKVHNDINNGCSTSENPIEMGQLGNIKFRSSVRNNPES